MRYRFIVYLFSLLVLLVGCTTGPSFIPQLVSHYGLQENVFSSELFDHKLFYNTVEGSPYLHVYVAGDGVPWRHRFVVASNPTPKSSLVLNLVGEDSSAAVFIGRPCYYGPDKSRNCNTKLWTSSRFSEEVVSGMVQALKALLREQPNKKVILFGFSGGGALVTLMAPRVPQVAAIVTVAGNLNTTLWTKNHHYTALKGSLNPIELDVFPRDILQFHIVGGKDVNVTRDITQSYVDKHGGEIWNYPGYTHGCCWMDIWPGVLQSVHEKLLYK